MSKEKDEIMKKYRCSACGEAENCSIHCIVEAELLPKYCPITGDETEFEALAEIKPEPSEFTKRFRKLHNMKPVDCEWCGEIIEKDKDAVVRTYKINLEKFAYQACDIIDSLTAENNKLNLILFHRENGLSHPDEEIESGIWKSKCSELQAELEQVKKENQQLRDRIEKLKEKK